MAVKVGTHIGCGGDVFHVTPMGTGNLYNQCSKCRNRVDHSEINKSSLNAMCPICCGRGKTKDENDTSIDCQSCNGKGKI